VLSRMNGQYGDYASSGSSPLPILAVMTALLAIVWSGRRTVDRAAPASVTAAVGASSARNLYKAVQTSVSGGI
jgi:hypothetical protein